MNSVQGRHSVMFQILGLLLLILQSSAQVLQCPGTFPQECSCSNSTTGLFIRCVTRYMDTWDIQATFDAISDAFNNTDTIVYSVSIDPGMVNSPGAEVPANSVSTLKIEYLDLRAAATYTRIDPDAFSGSQSTLEWLNIYDMDFHDTGEAFDLFNNFQVLRGLNLYGGTMSQIPAYAFRNDAKSLNSVYVRDAGLHSIGYLPFAELPNLMSVSLDGNNLTLANISETAFTFARTGIYLNLERNPGITHLPERKFGNFLRGNQNMIYVGYGYGGNCDPTYFLQCDSRIDWICDARLTRIYGYNCAEAAYLDIYDYCEQKFHNSPLYGEDAQEIMKIQFDDRLRHEKLRIEHELRSRYFFTDKSKRQNQVHV